MDCAMATATPQQCARLGLRHLSIVSSEEIVTCFVYVLASARGGNYRTYVGWTTDLDRRLKQHNDGTGAKSTRGRTWVLVYAERHATRRAAMSREWHLKRDRKLRKMLVVYAKTESARR
jgi:putative endonuclease